MGCSGRSHENELVVIQRSCYQIPSWRRRLFTVCFLTLLSLFFLRAIYIPLIKWRPKTELPAFTELCTEWQISKRWF
jgi:hypothetical protein